jgi:uncharacterized protein YukE
MIMFGLGVGMILRFARQIVAGVQGQLNQQMNIVTEQAIAPMQQMVQQVTGGVWTGQGADAFVQDVRTIMVPKTNDIASIIGKLVKDLQHASDVIDSADQQVQQKVQGLDDLFQNIFNG